MTIELTIPPLLQDCVGGTRTVHVEADWLDQALQRIQEQFPLLRPHIWDDHGQLRRHLLIFYNDTPTRWLERTDLPLRPGDRLTIVPAVSGG
ncbi:MAG: MoaD/ThiS family protein [Phycisphaerae bacterium]|nr:MoaD/ThiS family protein [Phycisphaerae bacterium]MDW8261913.1 MoaD/ThiS family protein [Phycisphaerales bacterium]